MASDTVQLDTSSSATQPNLRVVLQQVGELLLALGQATKDGSIPVTLASDQPIIPVNITDGYDTIGNTSRPVRIDPVGVTPQPVLVQGTVPISGALASLPAILSTQQSDGLGNYDLRLTLALLRELINYQIQHVVMLGIQTGQFVPQVETLPFLGA
jgi:hypothetical protein